MSSIYHRRPYKEATCTFLPWPGWWTCCLCPQWAGRQIRSWKRAVLNLSLMHGTHYPVSAKGPPAAIVSLPPERKRCSFAVCFQNWSRSCTKTPRGPALSRWWAPGICGKTSWCCASTREFDPAPPKHTHTLTPKLMLPVFSSGCLSVFAVWQVMGFTTALLAAWWTQRPAPQLCATQTITLWLASPWQPAWHSVPQWGWWVGVEVCSPSWSLRLWRHCCSWVCSTVSNEVVYLKVRLEKRDQLWKDTHWKQEVVMTTI